MAQASSSTIAHIAASQTERFASELTVGPSASWTDPSETVAVESPLWTNRLR